VPELVVSEAWIEDGGFIHFGSYLTDEEEAKELGGGKHLIDNLSVDRLPPPGKQVTLPPEFYLRELGDLDADDPEEILAFTNTWGLLGKPGLVEIGQPFFDMEHLRVARSSSLPERAELTKEVVSLVDPHSRQNESWENRQFVHFREISVHARLIRDLTRIYAVLADGRDVAELKDDWESAWLPRPEQEIAAQGILVDYLSHALSPFHVALSLQVDGRPFYEPWHPTLFATACLQLANDIAQKQPYRRCHKCGRQFVIQRGRAKYGQNRREGEIKFCSSSCAKAQAQRDLYRRQVEARRLHADGMGVEAIAEHLDAKAESVARWVKGR